MIQFSSRTRRLGISLSARGFGYAVLEGENRLLDFGRKRLDANRDQETVAGVKKLLARYQPEVLVLQDANKAKGTNRIPRIKRLTDRIADLGKKQKIKVVKISGGELRTRLLGNAEGTKHEMAVLLSQRFPEQLLLRLPAKRRVQDSEDSRMDYFDAVGLVVAD